VDDYRIAPEEKGDNAHEDENALGPNECPIQ
jgi:hypothetical protein